MNNEQQSQILEEAEQQVLATAIKSPNALPDILISLTHDDFFFGQHNLIFQAIENLNSNNQEITELTIASWLDKNGKLQQAGGNAKIFEISSIYYTDENIESYIDIIHEASAERKFKNLIRKTSEETNKTSVNYRKLLEKAQTDLLEIDFDIKKNDTTKIGDSAINVVKRIKQLAESKESLTGVSTGFHELDNVTSGLQPQDFIILAARPSMGKTAFALNLAYNAATDRQQDNAVAIFSVEMPTDQLTQRILSMETQINADKLRNGKGITKEEWRKINAAEDKLRKTRIFVDDTPGITVQQIQSKLHKLKRDENVNLCIIDYLQLISTPGSNGNDRQNEISTISRQLKRIARDTGVTIVCLSQLSRSVEKREDKRPIMSDLRDSGAIEQDADMIMFLYRKDYYQHNDDEEDTSEVSPTELIIAKHRNGATKDISLNFLKQYGKFLDK
ncbi:replicative DNA helicase [Mesoplasma lactucae]|uniref:Replicative DNA helicase n=2 Tax=Mesoplasma lactucae TaxID=138853 RepID=A0A291ISF8_9MOLU|nr:replicative DNA helicase [Mesoplasma lactucae]ATG97674.1 replicative DNA helicase [Mesoplasma lactucae ATCC 49193]ATZ19861.1 replicative DNA helicase [Mesoplasma lactucae ATCC 49193]MCL8216724.1 Replicative DNA helicase [Mesoplasma lactucae ATCC 49193]